MSIDTCQSTPTPMDVFFLGSSKRDPVTGRYLDDGFDYRSTRDIQDKDLPYQDEHGRKIIRLGTDVSLPFIIHCFGHHCRFDYVGQQADNMFELRETSGRFLIYRCDPPIQLIQQSLPAST